jgi:hypothetical protein
MITRGLIALLLAGCAGAAVVSAAAAPGVTLKVKPAAIVYGQEVTLSGKVPVARAGQKVIVRTRTCRFLGVVRVRTLRTRKNGSFSFRIGPTLRTGYSVKWGKRISRQVTVGVAPQVSLSKTGARTFSISVSAGGGSNFEGMQALLQHAVGKTWSTLATLSLKLTSPPTALTSVSTGTAQVQLPAEKHPAFRAVFPLGEAKPCYRAGVSSILHT